MLNAIGKEKLQWILTIINSIGQVDDVFRSFTKAFGKKPAKTVEQTAETVIRTEETPTPDVHLGGYLTYADETGFAKLLAELGNQKGSYSKAPMEICAWIEKNLKEDEQRRFRVIMSSVGQLTVEKAGEIIKKSTLKKIFTKKGMAPNTEEETKEERAILKENFGIAFLKVFHRANNNVEKKAMCRAIGVFDSVVEDLEKTVKAISKSIKKHKGDIITPINDSANWLKNNTGGEYKGFWSAAFPVNKKVRRRTGKAAGLLYVLRKYRSAILSGSFAGTVIILLICGIIFS